MVFLWFSYSLICNSQHQPVIGLSNRNISILKRKKHIQRAVAYSVKSWFQEVPELVVADFNSTHLNEKTVLSAPPSSSSVVIIGHEIPVFNGSMMFKCQCLVSIYQTATASSCDTAMENALLTNDLLTSYKNQIHMYIPMRFT